jgi:nitroreductase
MRLGELSEHTRLAGASMNRFVGEAPVIIAVVSEQPNVTSRIGAFLKNKPFYLVDIGIATEHLCLQAAELGLGTCMVGWFDEPAVARVLGVPKRMRVALLVTLGYPAASSMRPDAGRYRRKELSRIASCEQYGRPWEPDTKTPGQ